MSQTSDKDTSSFVLQSSKAPVAPSFQFLSQHDALSVAAPVAAPVASQAVAAPEKAVSQERDPVVKKSRAGPVLPAAENIPANASAVPEIFVSLSDVKVGSAHFLSFFWNFFFLHVIFFFSKKSVRLAEMAIGRATRCSPLVATAGRWAGIASLHFVPEKRRKKERKSRKSQRSSKRLPARRMVPLWMLPKRTAAECPRSSCFACAECLGIPTISWWRVRNATSGTTTRAWEFLEQSWKKWKILCAFGAWTSVTARLSVAVTIAIAPTLARFCLCADCAPQLATLFAVILPC